MTDQTAIPRFNMVWHPEGWCGPGAQGGGFARHHPEGKYVLYTEHTRALAALQRERDEAVDMFNTEAETNRRQHQEFLKENALRVHAEHALAEAKAAVCRGGTKLVEAERELTNCKERLRRAELDIETLGRVLREKEVRIKELEDEVSGWELGARGFS